MISELLNAETLAFLMFGVTMAVLMFGFPVAITIAGCALLFAHLAAVLGYDFPLKLINIYPLRVFGLMRTETLVAIPIFIFMGLILEKSKVAEKLLENMGRAFGHMRGGLGISVIIVGALLAASTGVVGATVVMMGLMSLPVMLRAEYDPKLSAGIICSSGTLGQIIPPSIVLILLADILQEANEQSANLKSATGAAVPDPVTAIDFFAGALLPGFLLVSLYIAYQVYQAAMYPEKSPAMVRSDNSMPNANILEILQVVLPPIALIICVIGSILLGAATPTEASAVGAIGAIILALLNQSLSMNIIMQTAHETVKITSMVFILFAGAHLFSLVFTGLGGTTVIEEFLLSLPGGAFTAMLLVMIIIFLLGFFLDFIEIILIIVPIVAPVLIALGYNPIWLGIMIGINLQTSFLTPPFGFALFYLRGVAPKTMSTVEIYKGVLPFIGIQVITLMIIWMFPQIVTYTTVLVK